MYRDSTFEEMLTRSYAALVCDTVSEYRERIRFLTDHLSRDPRNFHALNNRAQAHAELGHRRAAARDFDAAVRQCGDAPAPRLNRGRFREQVGDHAGALEDFTRLTEIWPDYTTAWRCRAYAQWRLGSLEAARHDFSRAAELEPRHEQTADALNKIALLLESVPNEQA